jgi:hypothetical protein
LGMGSDETAQDERSEQLASLAILAALVIDTFDRLAAVPVSEALLVQAVAAHWDGEEHRDRIAAVVRAMIQHRWLVDCGGLLLKPRVRTLSFTDLVRVVSETAH